MQTAASPNRQAALQRYRQSEKGKATQRRYLRSEKGRAGASARARLYYAADPGKYRQRALEYHYANPEAHRTNVLRRNYGLTIEAYNEMLARQQGTCALCGELLTTQETSAVDHDHDTLKVRGILCRYTCNLNLGIYEKIRQSAEAYLESVK